MAYFGAGVLAGLLIGWAIEWAVDWSAVLGRRGSKSSKHVETPDTRNLDAS